MKWSFMVFCGSDGVVCGLVVGVEDTYFIFNPHFSSELSSLRLNASMRLARALMKAASEVMIAPLPQSFRPIQEPLPSFDEPCGQIELFSNHPGSHP